jgi:hypothetical protein
VVVAQICLLGKGDENTVWLCQYMYTARLSRPGRCVLVNYSSYINLRVLSKS